MTRRWTYQVIEIKPGWTGRFKPEVVQNELNRLGLQGWELVSFATPKPMGPAIAVLRKEM
jgi:hypothetical protein